MLRILEQGSIEKHYSWKDVVNRILDTFNLYERNVYKCFMKEMNIPIIGWLIAAIWTKINKFILHKVYFNYVEVPITTKCSLRCKECANLIQYYQNGEFFDYKKIINDIHKLSQVSERIEMLRILGGEPLLHPDLKNIIEEILKNKNIRNIQIVTNGTMIFNENIIRVLKNKRVSVDISNYKDISRNYKELIGQLRKHKIRFTTQDTFEWTEQGDFIYQGLSQKNLERALKICNLDCISLLDGSMHLCPRSSHGNDLNIFKSDEQDYVNIRKSRIKKQLKRELFELLNKKSIVACNFCKAYMQDCLKPCVAGEQIGRAESIAHYNEMLRVNGGKR